MSMTLDPTRMRRLAVALPALYGVRSLATLAWIGAIVAIQPILVTAAPTPTLRLLLALYPAIDAVACVLDLRIDNSTPSRIAHYTEIALSVATAVWISSDSRTWDSLVFAVGIWAIATGLTQLAVALRRVRYVRGQWFMVISGAGSIAAGTTFTSWHGSGRAFLDLITQYAAGGLLWYAVSAAWATLLRPAQEKSPA
jgi:uncharacterized membrane protein HdeD (DUF308 family)